MQILGLQLIMVIYSSLKPAYGPARGPIWGLTRGPAQGTIYKQWVLHLPW